MARAAVPLEMCTGVPPAKSRPPRTNDQPLEFHVQHAIGSNPKFYQKELLEAKVAVSLPYTIVLHTKTKTIKGPNFPRSAAAPIAIIGLDKRCEC